MKKGVIIFSVIILIAIAAFFFIKVPRQESFEATPHLFKLIINKGEEINTNIEIKNLGKEEDFEFGTKNLENIVYLEKNNLIIKERNSEKLNITVSGLNNNYGVHIGHISISNEKSEKKIPFVISIHTPIQFFAINQDVALENKQLTKNDKLITEVKFFNLYDNQHHTVNVNYYIFNIDGEEILSESEQLTLDSKFSISKEFQLPENIVSGDYVFTASLDYLDTITTSTYLFSIVKREQISLFNIDILAWIVIIFASITFILILYLIYERSTLVPQLRKKQFEQRISVSKKISKEREKDLAKYKTKEKKKKVARKFKDAKKKILTELKKEQKQQRKKLKEMQKKKEIKEKDKKFTQWQEQSFQKAIKSSKINPNLKRRISRLEKASAKKIISEKVSKIKFRKS